jgi:hypothetical protein
MPSLNKISFINNRIMALIEMVDINIVFLYLYLKHFAAIKLVIVLNKIKIRLVIPKLA